jgi:hypothetical protein
VRSLIDQQPIKEVQYFRNTDDSQAVSSRASGSSQSRRNQSRSRFQSPQNSTETKASRAFLGYSENLPPPKYPMDDSNVSQYNTPESKGARGCRHCGSGKHWDKECKHARREANVNFVVRDPEDIKAEEEYAHIYEDASFNDPEDYINTNQQPY